MRHAPGGLRAARAVRILYLDKKLRLIDDEVHQTGTVDHVPVYPREIVRRALELSASALILVHIHNHPSGDPTPSRVDIDMTRAVVRGGVPATGRGRTSSAIAGVLR